MYRRRRLLGGAGHVGVVALAGCLADGGTDTTPSESLDFDSPALDETVPTRYTCDGEDVSPPLTFGDVPGEAETLAVVVDDPDASGTTFTHWLLWNVDATTSSVAEDVPAAEAVLGDARQGTNDFGSVGYRGPCPPADDDAHGYRFRAYALDAPLSLEAGAERDALLDVVDGHVLALGEFVADYARGQG